MKIGQYAQGINPKKVFFVTINLVFNNFLFFITDVKCIGHQEHITVEFVDVVLEEWTITVPG